MTRQEKDQVIEGLKESIASSGAFYIADTSGLTVAEVNNLRALCFEKGIRLQVAKNTLIKKALDALEGDYGNLDEALKGTSAVFFTEVANSPAKVIKKFREKKEKPLLKAACIETSVFLGDNQLDFLSSMKSKEEVIADVIALLQSPAKNVVSALKSSGGKLAGILQTLSERPE